MDRLNDGSPAQRDLVILQHSGYEVIAPTRVHEVLPLETAAAFIAARILTDLTELVPGTSATLVQAGTAEIPDRLVTFRSDEAGELWLHLGELGSSDLYEPFSWRLRPLSAITAYGSAIGESGTPRIKEGYLLTTYLYDEDDTAMCHGHRMDLGPFYDPLDAIHFAADGAYYTVSRNGVFWDRNGGVPTVTASVRNA